MTMSNVDQSSSKSISMAVSTWVKSHPYGSMSKGIVNIQYPTWKQMDFHLAFVIVLDHNHNVLSLKCHDDQCCVHLVLNLLFILQQWIRTGLYGNSLCSSVIVILHSFLYDCLIDVCFITRVLVVHAPFLCIAMISLFFIFILISSNIFSKTLVPQIRLHRRSWEQENCCANWEVRDFSGKYVCRYNTFQHFILSLVDGLLLPLANVLTRTALNFIVAIHIGRLNLNFRTTTSTASIQTRDSSVQTEPLHNSKPLLPPILTPAFYLPIQQ